MLCFSVTDPEDRKRCPVCAEQRESETPSRRFTFTNPMPNTIYCHLSDERFSSANIFSSLAYNTLSSGARPLHMPPAAVRNHLLGTIDNEDNRAESELMVHCTRLCDAAGPQAWQYHGVRIEWVVTRCKAGNSFRADECEYNACTHARSTNEYVMCPQAPTTT